MKHQFTFSQLRFELKNATMQTPQQGEDELSPYKTDVHRGEEPNGGAR